MNWGVILRPLDWLRSRGWSPAVVAGYAAIVAVFVAMLMQFYLPGRGFSYLITFGSNQEESRLSKVRRLDYHVEPGSDGYDAQYYAQIAMDPSLQNRELRKAVDSLPYRARRILFPATAHVLGLGQPDWILQAYALQGALAWLLLAVVLLHWFPPRDWDAFVRWAGVLLSFGMAMSVRHALIDGPSLLFVCVAVMLVQRNRPWLATAALALGGLGKETNMLGSTALLPRQPGDRRAWLVTIGRGVLIATPLALWLVYLALRVGPVDDAGYRNFDWPLAAYFRRWGEISEALPGMIWPSFEPLWGLAMLVALTVQLVFLVTRPRWTDAWWRVGATYGLLMVFLGDAVWEGYPGASSRVLLPMQVAFNALVPAGRAWMVVLLLGNLGVLGTLAEIRGPAGDGFKLNGSARLMDGPNGIVTVERSPDWHGVERDGRDFWMWSPGEAALAMHNPHAVPLRVQLVFRLHVIDAREVALRLNGGEIWRTRLDPHSFVHVVLTRVDLAPGANRLEFSTDRPPHRIDSDPRDLAYCVRNLRIDVVATLP